MQSSNCRNMWQIKGTYRTRTTQKMKFSLRFSSVNVTKSAVSVTFTEEILNGKLHFLSSVVSRGILR